MFLCVILAIVGFTLFCIIRYVILAEYNKIVIKSHISGIYTNLKNYSSEGMDVTNIKNKEIYEPKPV